VSNYQPFSLFLVLFCLGNKGLSKYVIWVAYWSLQKKCHLTYVCPGLSFSPFLAIFAMCSSPLVRSSRPFGAADGSF